VEENRRHPRSHVTAPIAFKIGDGPWTEAESTDIGLGGMFIETAETAPYGAAIQIYIQLPGLKQETLIDAVVRWRKETGMGVQFGVMGARETYALTQLISGQT
jgi:type IV pilus assembly protein PilZ